MFQITEQMKKWMSQFGKEYTDRSAFSLEELNQLHRSNYGITRTELNNLFIGEMDRNIRMLEIGSNIGNQLLLLQEMGFKNLYGIEINSYAVEISKRRTKNINIIQGSSFDIPFKNDYFDILFTSGLLIHINPRDIEKAMQEIYRCSSKYIWGFEYYSEEYQEILYRGEKNLLWKANFPKLYLGLFGDLELVKKKKMKYLNNENIDTMFLLRKKVNGR